MREERGRALAVSQGLDSEVERLFAGLRSGRVSRSLLLTNIIGTMCLS